MQWVSTCVLPTGPRKLALWSWCPRKAGSVALVSWGGQLCGPGVPGRPALWPWCPEVPLRMDPNHKVNPLKL